MRMCNARDAGGDAVTLPAIVPVLSATPGATLWAGPALGEHTDEVCINNAHLPSEHDFAFGSRHICSLTCVIIVQVLRKELGMSVGDIQRLRDLEAI